MVPLAKIQPGPRNPRQRLDGIAELAESLRDHGLLQPVVVRPTKVGYELIAGHRRLEAAKSLGWTQIAAVVRTETDDQAYILALVENLQREDLTPKEEAAALEVLVRERGWSTRQVAEAVKRSAMHVSKRLRVFEDQVLAQPVLANQLTVSAAEELLRIPPSKRAELVDQAIAEHWGKAEARQAVAECKAALHPLSAEERSRRVLKLASQLGEVLGAGPIADLNAEALSAVRSLANALRSLDNTAEPRPPRRHRQGRGSSYVANPH